MVKEKKKEDGIPRLKQRADGELVDSATNQCPYCKDKLK